MQVFNDHAVYDPAARIVYTPFLSDDGRVGYRINYTVPADESEAAGVEQFIYFNPSISDGDPDVFVYMGIENDPAEDEPQHFYAIDPPSYYEE